jgi:guanidinoacetate N-methyltransferase
MTRKLKRTRSFDLSLEVKEEGFIRPPRDAQRNWLLNRFLREAAGDLEALDWLAQRFVAGAEAHRPQDMRSAELDDEQIMEDWQLPLMRRMAEIAGGAKGDVLEVGFGRGISADLLQREGIRSHTIIECNSTIVGRFEAWRAAFPGREIRMVEGLWQDVMEDLGTFDSIFFHTYALDEDEAVERFALSVTFADEFFPVAAAHLRSGGVFTYLTNEIDSLSRSHQRLLLRHFRSVRVEVVPLDVPAAVKDAWWADSMVVVEVVK